MNTDKNILVTGGCGQVGVVVVKQLLEKGYKPVVLDINSSNSYINELINRGIIEFYKCNLLKTDEIIKLKGKLLEIQYVIHLASLVDGSADIRKSATGAIELNILATINLLSVLPRLLHLVYASSMMVYGIPQAIPISEEHSTEPINVYGATKLSAEKFLHVFSLQKKIKTTILRLSSLYGQGEYSEGNRNRVIPMFIRKIKNNEPLTVFPGDEYEIRDYLNIKDAADAIIMSLKAEQAGIFNIGTARGINIKELMDMMILISGSDVECRKAEDRPFKPANYTLNISKAKRILGFEPKISIEDGLAEEMVDIA